MKQGYLSQYFEGVGIKRLSTVEIRPDRSHQHEFNGAEPLKNILGEPEGKMRFPSRFLYLSDRTEDPVADDGNMTWYDARRKARTERGVMRWEYRLYFTGNQVISGAGEGDLLVIARLHDNRLLAIVAEKDSTVERQILWLFGSPDLASQSFTVQSPEDMDRERIGFAARTILEQIGIEVEEEAPDYLEGMLEKFGGFFPKTSEFSAYARNTLKGISCLDNPDEALMAWMEQEEILFRTLEKHLLSSRLRDLMEKGTDDPEPYIQAVQSTLQRRKSRAGSALENHMEQVFREHGITYTRNGITENRLKPDFIFPDIARYHDPLFPETRLTMLASKTTCKDRWRQILNEAARIGRKHLLTLEPGISENQTNEMRAEHVQLVLPAGLHSTYTDSQRSWLMDISSFIRMTGERQ